MYMVDIIHIYDTLSIRLHTFTRQRITDGI